MAWSRLQSASGGGVYAATPATATFGSNVSSGTKLIAFASVDGETATSVKDGAGNAFSELVTVNLGDSASNGQVSLWALDTPSGDVGTKPVISLSYTGTTWAALLIQEVSGLAAGSTAAAMLDGTAGTHAVYGAGPATSGAYSSSAVNEYLIAMYSDDEDAGSTTASTPTGSATYTLDAASLNPPASSPNITVAYGNSTGGAETASFSYSPNNSQNWSVILVAFKLAGATSTPGRSLIVPQAVKRSYFY